MERRSSDRKPTRHDLVDGVPLVRGPLPVPIRLFVRAVQGRLTTMVLTNDGTRIRTRKGARADALPDLSAVAGCGRPCRRGPTRLRRRPPACCPPRITFRTPPADVRLQRRAQLVAHEAQELGGDASSAWSTVLFASGRSSSR